MLPPELMEGGQSRPQRGLPGGWLPLHCRENALSKRCTSGFEEGEISTLLKPGGGEGGTDQIWDLLLSQRGTNIFLVEGSPAALPPSSCRVSSLLILALDCPIYPILLELSSK